MLVVLILTTAAQKHVPPNSASLPGNMFFFAYLSFGIAVLLLPTWVALWRRRTGAGKIMFVNLFLSWTVIGWVLALIFAFRDPGRNVTEPYICRNCYTASTPRFIPRRWFFGGGGVAPVLNCPRCNALNPVPLDTPAGREIAARTGTSVL